MLGPQLPKFGLFLVVVQQLSDVSRCSVHLLGQRRIHVDHILNPLHRFGRLLLLADLILPVVAAAVDLFSVHLDHHRSIAGSHHHSETLTDQRVVLKTPSYSLE